MNQATRPEISRIRPTFTSSAAKLAASSSRSALLAALAVGAMSLAGQASAAPSVQQLENQLLKIQEQNDAEIAALKAEIGQLKNDQQQQAAVQQQQGVVVARTAQQVAAQPVISVKAPKVTETATHQFGLASADGANSIALVARVQVDGADYLRVAPQDGLATGLGGSKGTHLESGVNSRRARLGVVGVFQNDWAYRFVYDFGGSSDTETTGVSGAPTSGIENAYITYNGLNKPNALIPLAFDLGYLDVPWTLDESTSSADIMFMERSSSQVIATEFGGGDARAAFGVRSNNKNYWVGAYLTGPTAGVPHTGVTDQASAALFRAGYQVLNTKDATIHLGVDYGHTFQARAGYSATGTGASATNAPYLTLSDRPELRVDPTSVLSTGAIPLHGANILEAEAAGTWGPLFVQGEYYYYQVNEFTGGLNPADGVANVVDPALHFHGGYVEGSYALGGKRNYIPGTGAYSNVIPSHPFDLRTGGLGALEFTARYGHVNLNDHTSSTEAPHLTGGVYGGDQDSWDIGLNWYPNVDLKFVLDYSHVDVSKLKVSSTDVVTPAGADINAIAARAQFSY